MAMRFNPGFRRTSLKTKLISSYLVILAIGGLATSVLGSWLVSTTIMREARQRVDRHLATARTVYEQQLASLRRAVVISTQGTTISEYLSAGNTAALVRYLRAIRQDTRFDFLTLTDSKGRVLVRMSQPGRAGDDVSSVGVVGAALAGTVAAGTEILPAELLNNEDPLLRERAYFRFVPTPKAKPVDKAEETSGTVLIAAAPVRGSDGRILGALYGGVLLNRDFEIVDRVWHIISKGESFEGKDVVTVTIFQNDLRISTNVKTAAGERALGTRVSEEVYDAVLGRGQIWRDRAFVVNDWYISAYDPIYSYEGKIVGILYVGLLEAAYTSTRNRVILSFFGIATIGFILIVGITYYMIGSITQPIAKMVAATRNIAAGRFDQEVHASSQDEMGLLAASFNAMLKSLRQMKGDLEEWGRTLEEKVKLRTEELMAMQARAAESERLASLGRLSAGVAHEVNNPLGGILALTALTLEDCKPDDPNRENLEEVLRQTERCRDIVKGLLDFSRQSEVSMELLDLNKVLQDTLSLLARQALFLNIRIVKEWDPDLPPVLADRSQLQQVFMNILLNAVQAMDEKGTIAITTGRNSADDFVEVQIADTGCGIPPDKIDRVFDPFFTTKSSGHGTGLGLSIAYGIVTKHRGNITLESTVGKGSTFTVRLPVATMPESDAT